MENSKEIDLHGYKMLLFKEDGKWKQKCVHRLVVENDIGRVLSDDETVHHLDGDKTNNDPINLLILENSQHSKLECWIRSGMPHVSNGRSYKQKDREISGYNHCKVCGKRLIADQTIYCSHDCASTDHRKTDRPDKETLHKLVWSKPTTHVAKELGISNVAIAKICKTMGVEKPPRGYWAKQEALKNKAS